MGGADNGTAEGPRVGGFRTLNSDDTGADTYSAQSSLSPDGWVDPSGLEWLNFSAANGRGLEMATAGTGVEVSDGFRDLNPTYPALLAPAEWPQRVRPAGLDRDRRDVYGARHLQQSVGPGAARPHAG
jgi:hypothetical protein